MLTIPKPAETLDFQIEGSDTVYSIPYAKDLPIDYSYRIAKLAENSSEEVIALLREIMERYAPGAWENITVEGLELILGAWKGSLGE